MIKNIKRKVKNIRDANLIKKSGSFDEDFYLETYLDVKEANVNPIYHYLNYGWIEGRNPSPYFNTEFYLQSNQDVFNSKINPLVHYIKYGKKEDRATNFILSRVEKPLLVVDYDNEESLDVKIIKSSGLFNLSYYKECYPDVSGCEITHYCEHGWKEGRNPSHLFNTSYYLEKYNDVKSIGINPFVHWINYGQKEGRMQNEVEVDEFLNAENVNSPSLIFISHEASETGAPSVLLSLMKWIKHNTEINFSIIVGASGPWNNKFTELAPTFFFDKAHTEKDIKDFCGDNVQCIYVNTIASAHYAKALEFLKAEYITHVHEMENVFRLFESEFSILKDLCSKYIAVSPGSIDSLNKRLNGKGEVNFIKPFIEEYSLQKHVNKSENKIIYGCGAVEKRKGFDLFCEVGKYLVDKGLNNFEMHWIGSDFEKDLNANETIKQYEVEHVVKFIGPKSNPRDYFSTGDIFLLPSREDPFPLVCLEGAEMGLPIICFDENAGGMSTFVENDAGIAIPYLDTNTMANKVLELLNDDELRTNLGKKACEKVKNKHLVDIASTQILSLLPPSCNFSSSSNYELCEKLIEKSEIVSFDIFDTLIIRELHDPNVVFDIMEYSHTLEETGILSLFDERMKVAGRVLSESQGKDDIVIDDIYKEMPLYRDCEIEKITEKSVCISHPVGKKLYEKAIALGKKIYITSDMYLDRTTIEAILNSNGYNNWDKLFLSSERGKKKDTGKLFKELIDSTPDILPSDIVHIGDNWKGDVECARALGLTAIRFSPIYEKNHKLIELSQDQKNNLSQMGRVWNSFSIQATNIWSEAHPELAKDFYTRLGFELTGPLASMMAIHAYQTAKNQNIKKIIFMARDGRIIKKAFDTIYEKELGLKEISSEYLHLSRATVVPATFQNPLSSNDLYFLIEGLHLSEKPISYYLTKANLNINDKSIISIVEKHFDSLNTIPSWSQFSKLSCMLEELSSNIYDANSSQRKGLEGYLRKNGVFDEEKVLVVDVGWLLNIQSRLCQFFDSIKSKTEIIGAYVGSRERINKGLKHSSLLYTLGEPSLFSKFLEENVTLFEVLFSSPEPSSSSIKLVDGEINVSFKSLGMPISKEFLVAQKLHMGAESYFNALKNAQEKYLPKEISRDYFYSIFESLTKTKNELALAELSNFEVLIGGHHEFNSYQNLLKNNSGIEYKKVLRSEYFEPIEYDTENKDRTVVIVSSAGLTNGSTRYRALNLAEYYQSQNIKSYVIHSQTDLVKAKALISAADEVIFQRCFKEQGNVGSYLDIAKKLGKVCIGEIDDLVFPEHIDAIGSVKGGEWDIKQAKFVAESYHQMFLCMDKGIVSTPALKDFVEKKYNIKCEVLKNRISDRLLIEPTINNGNLKLIYASGTYSHKEDFKLIEESLYTYLMENTEVTLSILGATQSSERILSLPNVCSYPLLPYEEMLKFISKHDLMLVPLVDDVFNNAKSNVKFVECGAVGVSVLASSVSEYLSCIQDGVDGYILFQPEKLIKKLSSFSRETRKSAYYKVSKSFVTYKDKLSVK